MTARKRAAKKSAGDTRTIEDRLSHVENTLGRLLEHHGETYNGATDDRKKLQDGATEQAGS